MEKKTSNVCVVLDARWTHQDRLTVGAAVLEVGGETRFVFGAVPSPATLYAASIAHALALIERNGGLSDRTLTLRFPAMRGAAFAKLITQPNNVASRVIRSGASPDFWHRLHTLHAAERLRLAWCGRLLARLAAPLEHYAALAQQLPAHAGLIHVAPSPDLTTLAIAA